MRVKVKDTGQLTSCFNESEGRKIQVRVKVEDTGQLTSCFNESEGRRYRSTNFVF